MLGIILAHVAIIPPIRVRVSVSNLQYLPNGSFPFMTSPSFPYHSVDCWNMSCFIRGSDSQPLQSFLHN